MQQVFVGIAVFICALLVCSITPGVLLYQFGYVPEVEWSQRAVQTECTVSKYNLVATTCGTKERRYSCYQAFINVDYIVKEGVGKNLTAQLSVCENSGTDSDVNRCVATKYSQGSQIVCFYDPFLPGDVRLTKETETKFYAYMFIAFVVGLMFAIFCVGIFTMCVFQSKMSSEMSSFHKEMNLF